MGEYLDLLLTSLADLEKKSDNGAFRRGGISLTTALLEQSPIYGA